MIKNLTWGFGLVVMSLFILSVTGNHKAAAFYTEYCDVLADPSSPGSGTAANCQNGQNNNGLTGLNTSSQSTLKASFIAKIKDYRANGYGFQKIGAAYIENHLQANGGVWYDNIDNPAVTLSIGSVPDAYACVNTAFYAPSSAVVGTGDCAYGAQSLLFYENGKLIYIIKIDCGNPLGNLGGPSPWNPNSPPTGSFTSVSCSGRTYTINASFSDPDGATNAYLRNAAGTAITSRNGSPTASWSANVNTWPPSYWPIKLYVADAGGSGDRYVDSTGMPNCVPIGNINSSTCTSFTGWAFDPNHTSMAVPIYYYIYKSDGTSLIEVRGGSDTNVARSDVNTAYGISGTHGFSISPLNNLARDFGGWDSVVVKVYAGDIQPNGTVSGRHFIDSATVGSCRKVSCTSNTFSGTTGIGVPETFTVTATASNVNNPAVGVTAYGYRPASTDNLGVVVKDPNGNVVPIKNSSGTTYNNADVTYSYGYPDINSATITYTPTKPGTYTMSFSFPYLTSAAGCGATATAAYQPFFNILGGDVTAGPGFGTTCTVGPGNIKGANLHSSNPASFYGAGSQLGALAVGTISGFQTATDADGSPSSNAAQGIGLAFSNTGGAAALGSFMPAGSSWCAKDYAGTVSAGDPWPGGSSFTSNHTYTASGLVNLGSMNFSNGAHVTLKVTGDVIIAGDVTYSYNSVSDMPQFKLLVSGGNIYIESGVSTLHGFYDAQPTTTLPGKGNIYTCTSGSTRLNNGASYTACASNKLTFYGAVSARKIYLDRTRGNLVAAGSVPADAAETFQFGPEMWLPASTAGDASSGLGNTYDAISSLPPVL